MFSAPAKPNDPPLSPAWLLSNYQAWPVSPAKVHLPSPCPPCLLLAHDLGAGATSGAAATPGFGCAGGTSGVLKKNMNPLFQILHI